MGRVVSRGTPPRQAAEGSSVRAMCALHSAKSLPSPCMEHIIALRGSAWSTFRHPRIYARGRECAVDMLKVASRMERLGTESAFEILAKAQALAATGKSIVNLCIGQPDFPPPAHVIEAGQRAIADGHHGYSAAPGILPLREAISADLHGRFDVALDPNDITITPGSKVALFFAIQILG